MLDVGPKRVDVVGCRGFEVAAVAANELVERVKVVGVGRRPLGQRLPGRDKPCVEQVEEVGVALRHLHAGASERVGARLEPLQQPRSKQSCDLHLVLLCIAADAVARRDVAGEGQHGKPSSSCSIRSASVSCGLRAHRDREPVEEARQRLVEVVLDLQTVSASGT